jgi:hypothetical protein
MAALAVRLFFKDGWTTRFLSNFVSPVDRACFVTTSRA